MKAAYYSRNGSYSRSYRAECAEEEGRFPRTRAAAAMGLSVKAFDAGCAAAGYVSTEWHHVGKYANEVDYYDTNELCESAAFWRGALAASSRKRRQTHASTFLIAEYKARFNRWNEAVARFKSNLLPRPAAKNYKSTANWHIHARRSICTATGMPTWEVDIPPIGTDLAAHITDLRAKRFEEKRIKLRAKFASQLNCAPKHNQAAKERASWRWFRFITDTCGELPRAIRRAIPIGDVAAVYTLRRVETRACAG